MVDVSGTEVFFEKDEEGNYRAPVDPSNLNEGVKIKVSLWKTIVTSLEDLVK